MRQRRSSASSQTTFAVTRMPPHCASYSTDPGRVCQSDEAPSGRQTAPTRVRRLTLAAAGANLTQFAPMPRGRATCRDSAQEDSVETIMRYAARFAAAMTGMWDRQTRMRWDRLFGDL